ncbi:MAG TPA: glycoside hydrolase family 43 protein [Kofleriaceae bacterium]|nr:glycoside hydrolase family 43 protein [Kofleriaceae bacterium]
MSVFAACAIDSSPANGSQEDNGADQSAALAVVEDDSLNEDVTDPPLATDDSADPTEVDDVFTEPDDLAAIAAARTYRNPIATDCADPGVIGVSGPNYYTVCTGFARKSSTDLVKWDADGALFKTKPSWGDGKWWAPEIHRISDNHFVAYFVANRKSTNRMCIGAATASSPKDTFEDIGHPLVCDGTYGLIDPNVFTAADGKHYLYYKIDGNAFNPPRKTIIYGHQLSADGLGVVGVRHRTIENTLAWEGLVTEAPWVISRGKYFYMFYSGAAFNTSRYGIGVARATSPLGPFHKRSAPILASNSTWQGPGHNSTIEAGGHRYIIYAAWHDKANVGKRDMLLDRISWSGGWPSVNNGTPSTGTHTAPTVP